jgi:hypothetical protein
MNSHELRLLRIFDDLPPTAVVPVVVAAAVRGVSDKTIRRNFPLVLVSKRRVGVRKSDLAYIVAASRVVDRLSDQ